jgi:hypothetical protein
MFVPTIKPQGFKQFKEEIVLEGHNLGDCQCPNVDIESSWRDLIEEVDVGIQTIQVKTASTSAQSTYFKDIDAQTDDTIFMQVKSGVADASLNPFLSKVTPLMESFLSTNDRSTAFEKADAMADDTQTTVDEVHALSLFDHNFVDMNSTEKINPHNLVCTSTSWNSTGYVLAVAYGKFDESGWTTAPGHLCTWNLGVRHVKAKKPDLLVDLDNPLQCIAFHPTHPALIAGGTLNGELYVWDLSREDPLRGICREPTLQSWLYLGYIWAVSGLYLSCIWALMWAVIWAVFGTFCTALKDVIRITVITCYSDNKNVCTMFTDGQSEHR